jgi:outer membrane protein assembly factor BamB
VRGGEPLTTSPGAAYGVVFVEGAWGFDPGTGEQVWSTTRGRLGGQGDGRRSSVLIGPGGVLYQNGSPCDIATARYTRGDGGRWASQNTEALREGTIYTTNSGVGGAVNLPVLEATDLETGRKRWSRQIVRPGQSVAERKVVLCSPAVWDERVYIGFDGGLMFAFDALRGEQLWAFDAGDAIRSSPSISTEDGVLYFGCHDANLYALDAAAGEQLWRFPTDGKVTSSACLADGVVFIGSEDGRVYALQGQ